MQQFDLTGKIALVSGCSQGLGYACVLALAKAGADIFGVSIGDDTHLKKEVEALGRQYHSLTLSIANESAITQVIKETLAIYGKIDILLNFAGILKKQETLEVSYSNYDALMELNLKASFFLSQAVIKQFLKQKSGGKIINASSVLTTKSKNEFLPFIMSKSGLDAMTRGLANEFGKDNIQVNAIAFGFMTTGTSLQVEENGTYDHSILDQIPAKRWGCYKDVDGLILLLASSASNYITGCCIPVDGGYSIHS